MKDSQGRTPFSIVMPVHNEEQALGISLHTIFKIQPDEVVVILDRCSDSSEEIIRRVWKRDFPDTKLKFLKNEEKISWNRNLNYLYDLGIQATTKDIVLLVQADIQYDYKKIADKIFVAKDKIVSFGVAAHPHFAPWNWAVTKLLRMLAPGYSGTVAFNKAFYPKIRLTPDSMRNFDAYINNQRKRNRLPYSFIDTNSLHFRPNFRVTIHFNKTLWNVGIRRYNAGKNFFKVFLWSLIRLTPYTIAGWLHARLAKGRAPVRLR